MNKFRRFVTAAVLGLAVLVPAANASAEGFEDHVRYGRVAALDTDIINLQFAGGTRNTIIVVGDGRTDLDCAVKDANGNTVAFDLDATRGCRLVVDARYDTTATLVIANWGLVSSEYVASMF